MPHKSRKFDGMLDIRALLNKVIDHMLNDYLAIPIDIFKIKPFWLR